MNIEKLFNTDETEELHLDLQPYVEEVEGIGLVLRHPIVYQVPYHPSINRLANQTYELKSKSLNKALEDEDWVSYVFLHERPYRLEAFLNIEFNLDKRYYWKLLRAIYTDYENIFNNYDIWKELIESQKMEKNFFMTQEEEIYLSSLPKSFTIFRGFNNNKGKEGISWTLSEEKAKWFAERYSPETSFVATAQVKRKDVIAYISSRNESEIVIFPENLKINNIYKL